MKYSELAVLLPCHSLEDFPVYHEGSEADQLLTAWSCLWHPALLAAADALPTWHRIDTPPDELSGRLLAVPPFCVDRLPAGYQARAQVEGAVLLLETERARAVDTALAALDEGDRGVDAQLANDFLALGFCRLQIELLTRQMRYSMYIDETHFQREALAAAQAAVAHDELQAREHLRQCFDTLHEARKHFYPVDVYLVDITLLADTTLGDILSATLRLPTPTNLLTTTATLERLAADEPRWKDLLDAIDNGRCHVLGGEPEEGTLPLLPLERVIAGLRQGVLDYERLLGRRPSIYARRRAGLFAGLPQLLVKLGYTGALHFTLDDGRFPLSPQVKTRWEGLDTSVIDVLDRIPCDATKPQTFLGLSRYLADTMDSDHVATLAIAHWPGATSPWYDDLRRIAQLSPVLGKFMLLDDYFNHTDMPGRLSKFAADEYRAPYLKQAIIRREPDPISRIVAAHRQQAAQAADDAIGTLAALVRGRSTCAQCTTGHTALTDIAALLPRQPGGDEPRTIVVNPHSFARQIAVEIPVPGENSCTQPHAALAEVPAMGFAWLDATSAVRSERGKQIAHDNVLSNDLFEVTISRKTGGIQSLFHFGQRGNRLSQQIALRLPGGTEPQYTIMQAEEVLITRSSPSIGEIASRGGLVSAEGKRVAGYRQLARMRAASRVLELEIELDIDEEPRADPWNAYYAVRFAWPDETTELWRGVGLTRQRTELQRFEAPEFFQLDSGSGVLSVLTGGLPYHRRSDARMLDTLLVVRGETARRFQLAIGVDLPQVAAAVLDQWTPATHGTSMGPPPAAPSGWFFHVGARNLVATHWEPLFEASGGDSAEPGCVQGFRVRLLETAGLSGRTRLRAFRNVASARQIDFLGQTMLTLGIEGDKITVDYGAAEWIEIEALWSEARSL
jgi:alpha-mannosidase